MAPTAQLCLRSPAAEDVAVHVEDAWLAEHMQANFFDVVASPERRFGSLR